MDIIQKEFKDLMERLVQQQEQFGQVLFNEEDADLVETYMEHYFNELRH